MRKTTFFVPQLFKVQLRYKYLIKKQGIKQKKPILLGIKKALKYSSLYRFFMGFVFGCFVVVTFRYKTY